MLFNMGRFTTLQIITSVLVVTILTAPTPTMKLPDLAVSNGLKIFDYLVQSAGIKGALNEEGPFTIFGPTDDAFDALPDSVYDVIGTNVDALGDVLTFHVTRGRVDSSMLVDEAELEMVNGQFARINTYPKGQSSFDVATIQCAPIDLSQVDLQATNGILHVLDAVMLPPGGTILMFLEDHVFEFGTLVTAIMAAGLDSSLQGPGPFTLFAPSDEAFAKLPPGTVDGLLADVDKLKAVLSLHVVQGTYCSAGLTFGDVETLGGAKVAVTVDSEGVKVKGSKVIGPDVSMTMNGVIHVIDSVILP